MKCLDSTENPAYLICYELMGCFSIPIVANYDKAPVHNLLMARRVTLNERVGAGDRYFK